MNYRKSSEVSDFCFFFVGYLVGIEIATGWNNAFDKLGIFDRFHHVNDSSVAVATENDSFEYLDFPL
jgi:hypothetical protein